MLTRIFEEAVREGLIAENPANGVSHAQVAPPKLTSKHGEARTRRVLAALPAFLEEITASTARRLSLLKLVRSTIPPPGTAGAPSCALGADRRGCGVFPVRRRRARGRSRCCPRSLQELLKEAAKLRVPLSGNWVFPNPVRPGRQHGRGEDPGKVRV